MTTLDSTLERFRPDLMATPSPALLLRARRLAQLSAAGRVFEVSPDHAGQVLRRLILKRSVDFPVTPGLSPAEVLSFVHGAQAIAATLCYGTARRARYLIREQAEHQVIFRNLKGTEHLLDREEALALFRGYRMTDVFLMPVPPDLTPVQPVALKAAPVRVASAPVISPAPVTPAAPRPAFQLRRPAFSGPRAARRQG